MLSAERKLFLATVIILLSHWFGTLFLWYQRFAWYDELMHFLGGYWVAVIGFVFLPRFLHIMPRFIRFFEARPKTTLIFFVFAVALLWELFEFVFSQSIIHTYGFSIGLQPGIWDTITDLFFGIVGAAVAGTILQRTKQKLNQKRL